MWPFAVGKCLLFDDLIGRHIQRTNRELGRRGLQLPRSVALEFRATSTIAYNTVLGQKSVCIMHRPPEHLQHGQCYSTLN
jgi:hypothetical protein